MLTASRAEESEGSVLYRHSAAFFDLRYAQKDYASEAQVFARAIEQVHPKAVSLLDIACGTGRHLEHLRSQYRVEGLDRSTELLQIARRRLGDVPLHEGDMADFDLGRRFDVVTCFFASIPYLGSVEALRRAASSMARHVAPGGILFIEPWLTPAVYREDEVVHNFRRTAESAMSWMYVQRRQGALAVWDIHWLLGTPEDGVVHFVEHEELSLFTTEECLSAIQDAGLNVFHHAHGLHGYGAFWARKGGCWFSAEIAGINEILPK